MTEQEIRLNFEKALNLVEHGWELSYQLSYGLSKKDIKELTRLYKENICRDKILELLEDCNFHYETERLLENDFEFCFKEEY